MYCQYTFVYCQKLLCIPNTQPIAICFEKGVSYMWPFCNHILGLLYVEIAKIVETWILVKKMYPGGDFNRDQHRTCNCCCCVSHPPTHLLRQWPFYLYRTRIGYIWIHNIRQLYEFIAHRRYEFIHFNVWIHFWWRDLAALHTWLQLWIHRRHLTHQHSISLLPCDQLGCVRLPRPVRMHSAAPTS